MPLIFATWEVFSQEDFARVLKLLSVITFRYSIICKLNPNLPDRVYPHAAKEVLSQSARTPSDVFTLIKSIYVDDEIMIKNFSTFALNPRGQNKKIVKYILATLEQDASGGTCDFETDHGTIEHILPENPMEQWDETFPPKYQRISMFRLGNLALLESSINRDIGNATYDKKSVAYHKSTYALTREIPEIAPEEWNLALLDKRQREFALKSIRLWRSDFA
ncbi:MAG: HNH endonuclease family protein [Bacteroidetes bacterium]|nr:HNH endonuclease family protein [Bacteroidota bacterium]